MKIIYVIICCLFVGCSDQQNTVSAHLPEAITDTIIKHDKIYVHEETTATWQIGFGLSHDPDKDSVWMKPVKYYLEDFNCSGIAIDFYYGNFRPGDNQTTAELLACIYTDNNKLRPFYRWCLNKTIIIQDGALGEYTGKPARRYAEKFPKEFFEYMDTNSDSQKYRNWVNSIQYSGFYENEHSNNLQAIRNKMLNTMRKIVKDVVQQ